MTEQYKVLILRGMVSLESKQDLLQFMLKNVADRCTIQQQDVEGIDCVALSFVGS